MWGCSKRVLLFDMSDCYLSFTGFSFLSLLLTPFGLESVCVGVCEREIGAPSWSGRKESAT